jgi:hypothetical protein
MRVVVGWIASCHGLPLDRLDDVYLSLETLLAEEVEEGGQLTLELSVESDTLRVLLGGLENDELRESLLQTQAFEPSARCPLDVPLFLRALVDHFEVLEHEAGDFDVLLYAHLP